MDRRLLRRARPARRLLAVDVALGLASAALVLAQALLLARVVAQAFTGAPVGAALALLLAAFAGRAALAWGFEVAGRRAAAAVLSELRLELVERRLRSQPAALDGTEAAEVAAAAVQGVDALEAWFARYLPQAVLACVVPLAVLATAAAVDPLSAGVMLLTLPLVPVFMWLIGRYTAERTRERWLALRQLSTHFLDVVRGLPTLTAFGRAEAQADAIAAVGERYRRATIETLRVSFLSGAVLDLAATIGVALVAVVVGVRLVGGSLGLQAGMTVLVLAPELYLPLRRLGAEYHASADGAAVAGRMLDLIDAAPAARAGGTHAPRFGVVRFEAVSFAYPARPAAILDGFDLELRPGETLALVGASGAGKSTVATLLLRFAEPGAGRITVDGVDLADCDADAWRRLVAWLPQRPLLFRGTIADNIRLGEPGAADARVREAARLAGAELPCGLETVVGDGGRALSAGERQRVALARAFLRDAPLVVLDEPTAHLDPENAELVAAAVERLRERRTVLLIAHRAELVRAADRVVRLAGGRAVVEAEAAAA